MIDILDITEQFQNLYGTKPRYFHAPGRVNLIGEHTDYNDGFVLPMAIRQGTMVAIHGRQDRQLHVRSLSLNASIQLDLNNLGHGHQGTWQDYVEGVAAALIAKGLALTGADILIQSDVSIGGGLSSSAALEIALATALISISNNSLDKLSLALAGQTAEHNHVGIHCGIMDQFTSVHALKNHAILLDCRSLEAKPIPLNLNGYQIVVCDSRVRHSLASSEYNQRRKDCEFGVSLLLGYLPGIRALRDVSSTQLETHRSKFPETVFRRCRHVVSENARTLQAADALISGDTAMMGKLMTASHCSLKEDYAVSCTELDILVESALAQPGVLGARMTGGGFGGCTVNLVEQSRVSSFMEEVARAYRAATGIAPGIFAAEAGEGAREL